MCIISRFKNPFNDYKKKHCVYGGAANPNANRIGWKKRLPQTDALKSYCSLSNTYTMKGVNAGVKDFLK